MSYCTTYEALTLTLRSYATIIQIITINMMLQCGDNDWVMPNNTAFLIGQAEDAPAVKPTLRRKFCPPVSYTVLITLNGLSFVEVNDNSQHC